jgi:hypothetical protein
MSLHDCCDGAPDTSDTLAPAEIVWLDADVAHEPSKMLVSKFWLAGRAP